MSTNSQPRELLDTLYAAINAGDTSQLQKLVAPEVLAIGTDAREWLQGKDRLIPLLQEQFREMRAAGVRVTPGDPTIGASDNAVWVADQPTMRLAGGAHSPVRVTLTATKDDEGSLLIQLMHMSFGVPNEQVFGTELSTS